MRIAYLDCFSGISGDMFLAALVDAGVPASLFEQTVAALNAAAPLDVRLEIRRVERSGISSTKVDVWVGTEKDQPRTEVSHHHQHSHPHDHSHDLAVIAVGLRFGVNVANIVRDAFLLLLEPLDPLDK